MLTILLYHGVTKSSSIGIENYSGKHIWHEEFERQMEYLARAANVISIDDVVGGKWENSVVVSFDDGFENNYSVARPILKRYNIPAIFYISSGIVNTDLMFWVDIIEDCINRTKKKGMKLDIGSFELQDNDKKINAIEQIKQYCKKVSRKEKDDIVKDLILQTEIEPSVLHSENYKKISWQQVRDLSNDDLFTVGGHSMYHDILSLLDHDTMGDDIRLSIDLLKYNVGTKIQHYSYPEGQDIHYNQSVINVLQSNGIVCSPSATHGVNTNIKDLFRLKRIQVGMNGQEFPFI